jgi:hypothetical protein
MTDIPENREIVITDSAPDNRTALLVEMSHDLGIQAEIAAINREFAVAEMDGLRSDLQCLRIDD